MRGRDCKRNGRIPLDPARYLWTVLRRTGFDPGWHVVACIGAIAALVVGAAGRCDAKGNLIWAPVRPIKVLVVVDTAYPGENLVARGGHVNSTIRLIAPLPPAGTVEPVTIADVDDGHRLSFSQTSFNLPANGNAMNFTIAGVHGSRNVGDALLQVRRGGEKLDANRRVTVYWFSNTSMATVRGLDYIQTENPIWHLISYDAVGQGAAVWMTASLTLNPAGVNGERLANQRLAVYQNALRVYNKLVYRVRDATWARDAQGHFLIEKGYSVDAPLMCQVSVSAPPSVDSLVHDYPMTYTGDAVPLQAGVVEQPAGDHPNLQNLPKVHRKSWWAGHPKQLVLTEAYSHPVFEFDSAFRDWTVTFDNSNIAGTVSRWAEADWEIPAVSDRLGQHVMFDEGNQPKSKSPTHGMMFGVLPISNDYTLDLVWADTGGILPEVKR